MFFAVKPAYYNIACLWAIFIVTEILHILHARQKVATHLPPYFKKMVNPVWDIMKVLSIFKPGEQKKTSFISLQQFLNEGIFHRNPLLQIYASSAVERLANSCHNQWPESERNVLNHVSTSCFW